MNARSTSHCFVWRAQIAVNYAAATALFAVVSRSWVSDSIFIAAPSSMPRESPLRRSLPIPCFLGLQRSSLRSLLDAQSWFANSVSGQPGVLITFQPAHQGLSSTNSVAFASIRFVCVAGFSSGDAALSALRSFDCLLDTNDEDPEQVR